MIAHLHPHQIVYSSGLIIPEPTVLATLSVFYDCVALPSLHTDEYIEFAKTGDEDRWRADVVALVNLRYQGADGADYSRQR